ncbi:dihydrodipicolinate synthase family protein [Compostibacter hankyongensis]|uniref:Dihydrodipicolinate synthase family protein n=1 Tax=Compostibacter hankyongensis TaxID=1007089 RepID=A0ABP8G5I3_9BACT
MNPLKAGDIRGNWATLLVPVNEDESIDFSRLADEIDLILSMRVDGIYSNGTAGEFYNQTEDEFDRISLLLAEKCGAAGIPFQIGCSHMSPVLSLERIKRTVGLKPGAIQVALPDWYPPASDEIIRFLEVTGAAAAPVGLVLYNPPHAKKRLTPLDFAVISAAGVPVVGCKVAGGDAEWFAAMKRAVPDLSLFVPGHTLATGLRLGAHGAYSNVACLHPGAAQRWYRTMLTDPASASELESRIRQFFRDHITPYITERHYSNQAVDKLLAAIGGWSEVETRLRWPYRSVDPGDVLPLRKTCREILPEFFPQP